MDTMPHEGATADSTRFRGVLEALAAEGWNGAAGAEFVALMDDVLARKAARIAQDADGWVEPQDVISEAVLIVSGNGSRTLAENCARLLAMSSPLGYVVEAVSAELARTTRDGVMGVGRHQTSAGVPAVTTIEPADQEGLGMLDYVSTRPAWALSPSTPGPEAVKAARTFKRLLAGRFKVRPEIIEASLETAADVAVEGERGAGPTPATTRRRLSRFTAAGPTLGRLGLRREQIAAMAGLLFGSMRHPEWSLYAACATAAIDEQPVKVTSWHSDRARIVAATGRRPRPVGRGVQPALFDAPRAVQERRLRIA